MDENYIFADQDINSFDTVSHKYIRLNINADTELIIIEKEDVEQMIKHFEDIENG